MGRVSRMPFVHYDKQKKRYFVERRVPDDVQPIIGKAKVKHLFPQSVDHATATDLSFHVIRRWEAEWIGCARNRSVFHGSMMARHVWAGRTAGGVREIQPVAEIMRQLVEEAEATLARAPKPH